MKNSHLLLISVGCILIALGIGLFNLNQVTQIKKQLNIEDIALKSLVESQASSSQKLALTEQELARRQSVGTPGQKTQDQLLTTAVAKTAPAVVSIVISKYASDLQVSYINPFGSDPFFKDFGFQIPVYRDKGTSLQKVGAGSGFLISHDGHILTNKHVVNDTRAEYMVLLSDGTQKKATVSYLDSDKDIAILKIDGTYSTVATLGDSSMVKLGQTVVAIGNALGEYSNSVSVGIISGLNRSVQASDGEGTEETLSGVFQTDASINPGNSGGPLVDLSGSVIGINVATVMGGSNISFAIPINAVKKAVLTYVK